MSLVRWFHCESSLSVRPAPPGPEAHDESWFPLAILIPDAGPAFQVKGVKLNETLFPPIIVMFPGGPGPAALLSRSPGPPIHLGRARFPGRV